MQQTFEQYIATIETKELIILAKELNADHVTDKVRGIIKEISGDVGGLIISHAISLGVPLALELAKRLEEKE